MRPIRATAATLAALPLAALVLSSALAQRAFDMGDFEAAMRLDPLSSEAPTAQAAALLGEDRQQEAERLARAAIDKSPLNAEAAAILGYIKDLEAGPKQAAALMETAAAMSWATDTAQLWMLGRAAAAKNYEEAVLRADALLRQRLFREELFAFVRGLTADPASLKPLARRLAVGPKWRVDYMQGLNGLTPQYFAGHEALLAELERTSAPPTREEIRAYAARLVFEGQHAQARAVWVRFGERNGGADAVTDPTFQDLKRTGLRSPFEWTVKSEPGVSLELQQAPGNGTARTLHISSDGRPSYRALEQVVVLAPGIYTLSWEAKETEPSSLDSLQWEVTCLGGGAGAPMGTSTRTRLAGEWQRIERAISIPATCTGQRLELRIDHDTPDDLDVWIRSVRIRRLG